MTRIIIFAKAPVPGFAKTRLIPALGEAGAAGLARQMLFDTLKEALAAGIGPVELCVWPPGRETVCRKIVKGKKMVEAQPAREVEDVEWVCDEPILADAPAIT